MISIRSRALRLTRLLLLPLLTSIALGACSNGLPAPLAIVAAPPLPSPERPAPKAPPPVNLYTLSWTVVLDPKTHEPMFALTTQGFTNLEHNMVILGGWMTDAKSVIDFYRADARAANAKNDATAQPAKK